MARVLIGWELGGGHGHAVNQLAVARGLAARGHEVVLVSRDPVSTWPVLREAGFPVLQAPLSRPFSPVLPGGRPFRARSFADVLAVHGYAEPDVLQPLVQAWKDLLDTVRPDLVLAEFAPLLCVASHGRVPCVSFGNGFCVPCLKDGAFPVFAPEADELVPVARLAANVSDVMRRLGLPVPENPLQAFVGGAQLDLGFDELDPYRAARSEPALGPPWALPRAAVPFPSSPACLVYLPAQHRHLAQLVDSLVRWRMPGVAYVRDAGPRVRESLARSGMQVSATPLSLEEWLPKVSLVVHHGGVGTAQRCLAWGRPQVIAPMVLEQEFTGDLLRAAGTGLVLGTATMSQDCSPLFARAAADQDMAQRAQAMAVRLRGKYADGALDRFIARCFA